MQYRLYMIETPRTHFRSSNDRTNIDRALHIKIEGLSRHLTLNVTCSHSQCRWNASPSSIYGVAGQRSKALEDSYLCLAVLIRSADGML
eukprot:scaffold11072_cov99-Skeletonema_dohrnii-CCMP3373.AAC.11